MRALAVLVFLAIVARAGEPARDVTTNGRDEIRITVSNAEETGAKTRIAAGAIYSTGEGRRMVTLRETVLEVPPRGTLEARIPAAALSISTEAAEDAPARAAGDPEPKLAGLLKLLAAQPDLPRTTSQCAVFALTEDITFAQWVAFRAGAKGDEPLLEAIDALGILRAIAPEKGFRLAADPELKLRALRHPGTRAKAGQLYGLALPGNAPPGATPPDVGQLLHTKSGDNCPVCRMRERMQNGASNGL